MNRTFERLRYRFPALAIRNFRLFLAGQGISVIGTWMQGPVLSWIVYEQTQSDAALGWLSFLRAIPLTIMAIPGGVIADRYAKRYVIVATQTALMLAAFSLAALAWLEIITVPAIYFIAVLTGIARAFDVPARQAFIMEVSGREAYTSAIALNSATFNTARVVGPAIGTSIYVAAGATMCFFGNGLTYVGILAALLLMRDLKPVRLEKKNTGLKDLVAGLKYIFEHRSMLTILIIWATYTLFGTAYITLLASIAKSVYGKEAGHFGLLVSAQGFGALVAAIAIAVTAETARPARRVVGGLALFCLAVLAMGFNTSYVAAVFLMLVYGFGMVLFLVSANILLQLLSKDEFRGRVMGVRTLVFGGFVPFGGLMAGYFAKFAGNPLWAVRIGGVVLLAVFLLLAPRILATRVEIETAAGESPPTPEEAVR